MLSSTRQRHHPKARFVVMTDYGILPSLPRPFFLRPVLFVARDLVGKLIVFRQRCDTKVVRIVETEAYAEDDPASHAYGGSRGRNTVMFRSGGVAYVYKSYGIHDCLNVVTGPPGRGEAVLIRAGEPIEGIEEMWQNRFPHQPYDPARLNRVAGGPGNLTRALGITKESHNGADLIDGDLRLCDDGWAQHQVVQDLRIGISRAAELPWRFLVADSPFVSRRPRSSGGRRPSEVDRAP
jgi:DNA-3-methyladenine glycosylase